MDVHTMKLESRSLVYHLVDCIVKTKIRSQIKDFCYFASAKLSLDNKFDL